MRDSLDRPATPATLHRLRDAGVLAAEAHRRALAIALASPSPAAWHRFLDRALLGTGAALTLAGILYFFARNWADLGRFGRFALVEAAILIAAFVAWRGGLDRLAGQVGGLAATALAGVALAVVGQSYQLGADPWRLFAATAALGVPWLVATRFAPLFVLILVLAHVALVRWWPLDGEVASYKLLLTAVGIDALAWMAWERVPAVRAMAGRWVPRLLALGTLAPLTSAALWLMVDDRALRGADRPVAWQAAVLAAWIVATVASLWLFRRWRGDLFVLALAVVGLVLVAAVRAVRAVFDALDTDGGTLELLLAALVLGVAAGIAATWLRRLQLGLAREGRLDADAAASEMRGAGAGALARAAAGGIASSPLPVGAVLEAVGDPGAAEGAAAALAEHAGEGSPWYVRLLVAGMAWLAALALFAAIGAFFLIDEVSLAFGIAFALAAPWLARRLPADEARGARAEFAAQGVLVASLATRILVGVGLGALDLSTFAVLIGLAALEVWLGVTVPDRLQRFLAAALAGAWLLGALSTGPFALHGAPWPGTAARTGLLLVAAAGVGVLWLARARLEAGAGRAWHAPVAYGAALFVLAVSGAYSLLSFRPDGAPLIEPRAASAGLVALLLALWWVAVRDLGRPHRAPAALAVAGLVVALGAAVWREPGLLAALGALALAFHVRARRLAGLAVVAVALFLWLYYYHLRLDFLAKSLVLVGSGLVLLAGRWVLLRALSPPPGAVPLPAPEAAP